MKRVLLLLFILILFTGCLQQSAVKSAVFRVNVDTIQNCAYMRDEKTISIIVKTQDDRIIDYRNPKLNFTFEIIPPSGSYRDDYAYLFFSAHDYDPRIFRDSEGIYQIKWTHGREIYLINGYRRLQMLDTYHLNLELKLNPFQLSEIQDSSMQITFHNKDNSWSDTYTVNFVGVEID